MVEVDEVSSFKKEIKNLELDCGQFLLSKNILY